MKKIYIEFFLSILVLFTICSCGAKINHNSLEESIYNSQVNATDTSISTSGPSIKTSSTSTQVTGSKTSGSTRSGKTSSLQALQSTEVETEEELQLIICYPGFVTKAVTLSYDDGNLWDRKLTDIFKKYNLKATFNIQSGALSEKEKDQNNDYSSGYATVSAEEVKELYSSFEVAGHTKSHKDLTKLSLSELIEEITDDKRRLEELTGTRVDGLAYPGGIYDSIIVNHLKKLNLLYARTVASSHNYYLPSDFLLWNPTCRDDDRKLEEMAVKFIKESYDDCKVFYVWGHSVELEQNKSWARMEKFCSSISGKKDIWYATNIEICRYIKATRELTITGNKVKNTTSMTLYVKKNGVNILLTPGKTV